MLTGVWPGIDRTPLCGHSGLCQAPETTLGSAMGRKRPILFLQLGNLLDVYLHNEHVRTKITEAVDEYDVNDEAYRLDWPLPRATLVGNDRLVEPDTGPGFSIPTVDSVGRKAFEAITGLQLPAILRWSDYRHTTLMSVIDCRLFREYRLSGRCGFKLVGYSLYSTGQFLKHSALETLDDYAGNIERRALDGKWYPLPIMEGISAQQEFDDEGIRRLTWSEEDTLEERGRTIRSVSL